jgi:methionyl-tRNA formyltransferase
MNKPRIVFFGSTHDSVRILDALHTSGNTPIALVTQPPKPIGRDQVVTPTPVALWGAEHTIPGVTFPAHPQKPWLFRDEHETEKKILEFEPELLVSASYGLKIPATVIYASRFGGLNVHPSLLPRWRGADPVPWAILSGDTKTGVSVVTLSERFDQGLVLGQKELEITGDDYSDPLRTRLFQMGAELLLHVLPSHVSGTANTGTQQNIDKSPYARRFTRQDGFIPWEMIELAQRGQPDTTAFSWDTLPIIIKSKGAISANEIKKSPARFVYRMMRALSPWPGVHTLIPAKKGPMRVKILMSEYVNGLLELDIVQPEGKKPVSYAQFRSAYLPKQAAGSA